MYYYFCFTINLDRVMHRIGSAIARIRTRLAMKSLIQQGNECLACNLPSAAARYKYDHQPFRYV